MRYKAKYKPELICSKDELRPVLHEVRLTKVKGKPSLVATNGRTLVVMPVVAEKEEFGTIPNSALKFARKNKLSHRQDEIGMKLNGKVEFENGWSMPRDAQLDMNFPNVENVIPTATPMVKIALDAKYLWDLAQAMGVTQLQLSITNPMDAVLVTAHNETAYGVIMPVRLP